MKDQKEFSIEDIQKFKLALEKTTNTQIMDFFTIIFNTGFRATELLNLKFTDVDYKSNSLTIGLKKRSSNNLYHRILNDECMQVLIRLKDEYPNDVFVFQSRKSKNQTNKPASSISRQVVAKAFKTASDITSLPITTSTLRGFYARQIISMNTKQKNDYELLSLVLGHEQQTLTKYYANYNHINNEELSPVTDCKADKSNRDAEIIEYLLKGRPLSESCDLDNICKQYGISETDLAITLKTVEILAKPMRSGKKS